MITNEEKIDIIKHRLDTLEFIMNSFIEHAEEFQDKYSLEDELLECDRRKTALLEEKEALTN
jgi:transcription antitermination factor NusA-like protein